MSKDAWFSPRDIRFTLEQVIWLLSWLPTLKEGHWPTDPHGTGYTEAPGGKKRKSRNQHAPFETPCQVAGELEARLAQCGQDGLLIEALYCWGKDTDYLCQYFNITEKSLNKRCELALKYISGWKRKRRFYSEFCRH